MTRWRRAGVRVAHSLCGGGALPEASLSAWLPRGGLPQTAGGVCSGPRFPARGSVGWCHCLGTQHGSRKGWGVGHMHLASQTPKWATSDGEGA